LKASSRERELQQTNARLTKQALVASGLPVMPTDTHIVPLMVGDADLCRQASVRLLEVHGIYIQPINYPTVPRGTERLRLTPTPAHDAALIAKLTIALVEVWNALGLPIFDAGEASSAARPVIEASNATLAVFPPAGG